MIVHFCQTFVPAVQTAVLAAHSHVYGIVGQEVRDKLPKSQHFHPMLYKPTTCDLHWCRNSKGSVLQGTYQVGSNPHLGPKKHRIVCPPAQDVAIHCFTHLTAKRAAQPTGAPAECNSLVSACVEVQRLSVKNEASTLRPEIHLHRVNGHAPATIRGPRLRRSGSPGEAAFVKSVSSMRSRASRRRTLFEKKTGSSAAKTNCPNCPSVVTLFKL